jgi:fatty-acyl-CoA synthase
MHADERSRVSDGGSVVRAIPLDAEPGLGALCIPGYLREVTQRWADREALVWRAPAGVERRSYAALWERSLEVARALAACGVGKDGRVGILMTNRPEHLAAAFGAALAGGVIVELNTFATAPELAQLLEASSVSTLLFERRAAGRDFAAVLRELEPAVGSAEPGRLRSLRFPFLRRLAMLDGEAAPAQEGAIEGWTDFLRRSGATPPALVEARAAAVTPADVGALFFSSGTTSKPKGILHSQRAVALQGWRWPRVMRVGDDVRAWTANGFFWSGNFSMVIGSALSSGGAIVLQPVFQAEAALALMEAERVTMPFAWPHPWAKLEQAPNWSTVDLGSLRYVDGATPLARHPSVTASWQLPPSYGTTETLTIHTSSPPSAAPGVPGASGAPLPGNTVKIVDPLTGAVQPRGARGEIAVKGPTLMLGYVGVPNDRTLDADGFFHTGDGGYLDEAGQLVWEGRLSDVIKTGGANVSPREIDELLATHPAVRLVRTVGVPHETLGEMVVSCIVAHEGAALEEEGIRAFARERLASYKVPRRVVLVRDDELSMTGSEKVKADALRRLAAERLGAAPRA